MNTHYAMNSAQVRMCVINTVRRMTAKGFPVFGRIRVRQGQSIRESVLGKTMAFKENA
jgi:hypothetical protein